MSPGRQIFAKSAIPCQAKLRWSGCLLDQTRASLTGSIALSGSAEFCAAIARQYLEDSNPHCIAPHAAVGTLLAALPRTAWCTVAGRQQPDANAAHILTVGLSGALDLFFTPIGQIALTEPNQQAFCCVGPLLEVEYFSEIHEYTIMQNVCVQIDECYACV